MTKLIHGGNVSRFEWEMAIRGETFPVIFYRLVLPIDKAMIRRKDS